MEKSVVAMVFVKEIRVAKALGVGKELSSTSLRLGAMVTSNDFFTASLDLERKQKEKEEKKQHKKTMEADDEREDTRSP